MIETQTLQVLVIGCVVGIGISVVIGILSYTIGSLLKILRNI